MIFLEVVEHSCAAGTLLQGESLQNISKDMDIVSYKLPLGVTGGICPFNFPAMIPLWMFPLSLIAGNTMIIKPSERDPGATMLLMELLNEVGCPPGVVNVSKQNLYTPHILIFHALSAVENQAKFIHFINMNRS